MRLISVTMFILFIQSCSYCNKQPVCEELNIILDNYINSHDYMIYSISMLNIDDVDILTIDGAYAYDKDFTDGYFFKNGKLVVYCNLDRLNRKNIIYQNNTYLFKDTIPGYPEISNVSANFETDPQEFRIVSPKLMEPIAQTSDSCYKHKDAVENNVINDINLSKALNRYINTYSAHLYEINFKKKEDGIYAYICGVFSYDENMMDGYFFRNTHLVVLYNTNLINDFKLIDYGNLLHNISDLDKYRNAKYRAHVYPYTQLYKISMTEQP